eukprot:m.210477 g.210477  ORF g.210477 m.210477 type:complete len:151 (+) comp13779_c2_seq50:1887-2339(+)
MNPTLLYLGSPCQTVIGLSGMDWTLWAIASAPPIFHLLSTCGCFGSFSFDLHKDTPTSTNTNKHIHTPYKLTRTHTRTYMKMVPLEYVGSSSNLERCCWNRAGVLKGMAPSAFDDYEVINLAGNPAYADVQKSMTTLLKEEVLRWITPNP